MRDIPPTILGPFNQLLERKGILPKHRTHYQKWLRFYLDFCDKHDFSPNDIQQLPAFIAKLISKGRRSMHCRSILNLLQLTRTQSPLKHQ